MGAEAYPSEYELRISSAGRLVCPSTAASNTQTLYERLNVEGNLLCYMKTLRFQCLVPYLIFEDVSHISEDVRSRIRKI